MKVGFRTAQIALAMLLTSFIASQANAGFVALESIRTNGNQSYTQSLSMYFDVLDEIRVTQLGVFDSGQDGLNRNIEVGIYDRITQQFVTDIVTLSGVNQTLVGNSRFYDITDVVLGIGEYAIVARGYGNNERNGNSGPSGNLSSTINTGNGLIAFVGRSYFGGSNIQDLNLVTDSGPANRYDAGTFMFEAVTVNSPATLALFSLALVCLVRLRKA